jgi:hypothetical protein
MYPKIGLGVHNIPPAPFVKFKIQDKSPLLSPASKTLYK